MIYHIAEIEAWENALKDGWYYTPSLEQEGFIHFSSKDQFIRVANFLFKGKQNLILLQVDEKQLAAPIKYEGETDEKFPHLYGKLNTDAVVRTFRFSPNSKGEFEFPLGLS